MEIELSRLTEREEAVSGEVRLRDDPPGSPGELAPEGIAFPEPVRFTGTVRREGAHVIVAGRLDGRIEVACSKCLTPVEHPVDIEFQGRYASAAAAPEARDADGVELEAEDLDVSFLPKGATHLDLAEVAREQVLLDLPPRTVCGPECQGLCPRCGADLNQGECGHDADADEVDPRLAALLDLKKRLGGPSGK